MNNTFKTPILYIVFNRPDTTQKVFEVIRQIRPENLYIAADGARENRSGEKEKCMQVRKITEQIDWPCDIHTNFQEKNLGCKFGPIKAIDWLFENVDRGIILEDDCLPDLTFFSFCEELLYRYENNPTIMHISGNNFQNGILRGDKKSSYYFSKYTHSWGWATWKRSWSLFNKATQDFDSFERKDLIRKVPIGRGAQKFWAKNFKQTIAGTDSWDSLWMYTVWYNEGLAILPQKNLVTNIGFGKDATHTKDKQSTINNIVIPINKIINSDRIIQDKEADIYTFKKLFKKTFFQKIYYKIKKILNI